MKIEITDINYNFASNYQPLNAKLTAYAGGDTPSAFTLGIVDSVDAAAWRTALGVAAVTPAALTKTDDTNVTLTLGGSPATSLLAATSLTLGWTGSLSVARGGTGTVTAFTAGSVVFAGASGVYSQDNANLFWDNTNKRMGIGNNSPQTTLAVGRTGGGIATATPAQISLGDTFANTAGDPSKCKFQIFRDTVPNIYGVGISNNLFEFHSGAGSNFEWFFNGVSKMILKSNGQLFINTTVASPAGFVGNQIANPLMSSGSSAGYFWENRSGGVTTNTNWYGWYTSGGTIFLWNGGANIASINSSTGAYTALSDAKAKKNIVSSNVGLNEILALRPVTYEMRDTGTPALGLIEQEVAQILPSAVVEIANTDAAGEASVFSGITDRAIITALVGAVKELSARVETLEKTVVKRG